MVKLDSFSLASVQDDSRVLRLALAGNRVAVLGLDARSGGSRQSHLLVITGAP